MRMTDFLHHLLRPFRFLFFYVVPHDSGGSGTKTSQVAKKHLENNQPHSLPSTSYQHTYQAKPPTSLSISFPHPTIAHPTSVSQPPEIQGLANARNNCWANALMQMILHAPHFQHDLLSLSQDDNRFSLFRTFIQRYNAKEPTLPPDSQTIRQMIHELSHGQISASAGEQEDAAEALSSMLTQLHEKKLPTNGFARQVCTKQWCSTGKAPEQLDAARADQFTQLNNEYQTKFQVRDPLLHLSIPPEEHPLFATALDAALNPHSPEDHTAQYLLPGTNNLQECEPIQETISFETAPPYLLVPLKRFEHNPSDPQQPNKISTEMAMPEKFDLPHVTDQSPSSFSLKAFVVHIGSTPTGGHYVAYVKRKDGWYLCDDRSATKKSQQQVRDALKTSYLHYYENTSLETPPVFPSAAIHQPPPSPTRIKDTIFVRYNAGWGNRPFIRGEGAKGLNWEEKKGIPMTLVEGTEDLWMVKCSYEDPSKVKFKILLNDEKWEDINENRSIDPYKATEVTPTFRMTASPKPVPVTTTIFVSHDAGWGNRLEIRGTGAEGLSWDKGPRMECMEDGKTWMISCTFADPARARFKIVKILANEQVVWEEVRDRPIHPNNITRITPKFP